LYFIIHSWEFSYVIFSDTNFYLICRYHILPWLLFYDLRSRYGCMWWPGILLWLSFDDLRSCYDYHMMTRYLAMVVMWWPWILLCLSCDYLGSCYCCHLMDPASCYGCHVITLDLAMVVMWWPRILLWLSCDDLGSSYGCHVMTWELWLSCDDLRSCYCCHVMTWYLAMVVMWWPRILLWLSCDDWELWLSCVDPGTYPLFSCDHPGSCYGCHVMTSDLVMAIIWWPETLLSSSCDLCVCRVKFTYIYHG